MYRVPPGLEAEPQRGEDKGRDWGRDGPPALRVDVGLSEHGEAVLRVRVELGLPPWAEVSHWRRKKNTVSKNYKNNNNKAQNLRIWV